MATRDSKHETGSHRDRSPITAAAILLGIYIAIYLAVGGIVHVLTSPDAAAAVAPGSSMAPAVAATASTPSAGEGESPPSDSLGQVSERVHPTKDSNAQIN